MSWRPDLVELLSEKPSILLDFDGSLPSNSFRHPAPGVAVSLQDVIGASEAGKSIAIVSNNSAGAIQTSLS
jgi:hypothetical protein